MGRQALLLAVASAWLGAACALAHQALGKADPWPAAIRLLLAFWLGWLVQAGWHRRGRGDPYLFPLACMLCSLGWVVVFRLDPALGLKQADWIALGIALFLLTAGVPGDYRSLEDYKWAFLTGGVLLQAAVMLFGVERNGARLWLRLGAISFQPGEAVKILVVLFLAAFLRQFRSWIRLSLLSPEGGLPRRALLLLGLGLAACEGVLVLQRDLGMALLFFGLFLGMFYVGTGRTDLVASGGILFAGGARIAYELFGHVRERVQTWLDPFADPHGAGYQMVQALYSMAWGGVTGTGLGLGSPDLVPEAATDFVFVALAEELGLLGAVAVVAAFMLLVGRAFRIALLAGDEFGTLAAAGLGTLLAWQALILLCGTVKMAPMTGITLPFMSYGGSSMLAGFLALGLLWRISAGGR